MNVRRLFKNLHARIHRYRENKRQKQREECSANQPDKLRSQPLTQESGEWIEHLLKNHGPPSKELLRHVREWCRRFPDSSRTPFIVGKWLRHKPSNEAVYLAERYLQSIPDLMTLKEIIRGAGSHPRRCRRLFKSIEILLERYPSGPWDQLQAFNVTSKSVDKLLLRWLELNRSNPSRALDVSMVAITSESYVVLKSILNWMTESGANDDRDAWHTYNNLTYGKTEARTKLLPETLSACRSWILTHPRAHGAGYIVGRVIRRTCSEDDVRLGLNWYYANRDAEEASSALTAILLCARKANVELDATILNEAKSILRDHEQDG